MEILIEQIFEQNNINWIPVERVDSCIYNPKTELYEIFLTSGGFIKLKK